MSAAHDDHTRDAPDHDHDNGHEEHAHRSGLWGRVVELFAPHSHDAGDAVDSELEASALGIRALIISFAGLAVTAALQLVVVLLSNSIALLGDTLHNFADALTAIPLAIAFTLGRRAATRRFTYGYGRAEDLAGLVVVLLITASSALAAYEAIRRLLHPQSVQHLALVAVASMVGFIGNEAVARYRITVGRRIGSAALVADGLHARTDGLTSLAVLIGAGEVALGWRLADPIIGMVITVAILSVLKQAAGQVFRRLMDAVDPTLLDRVENVIAGTPGVLAVGEVKLRWIGHALRAECQIVVAADLTLIEAQRIAEDTEHQLLHDVPPADRRDGARRSVPSRRGRVPRRHRKAPRAPSGIYRLIRRETAETRAGSAARDIGPPAKKMASAQADATQRRTLAATTAVRACATRSVGGTNARSTIAWSLRRPIRAARPLPRHRQSGCVGGWARGARLGSVRIAASASQPRPQHVAAGDQRRRRGRPREVLGSTGR